MTHICDVRKHPHIEARLVLPLLLALVVSGCGKDSPSAPTTPPAAATPAVSSLTVTGLDAVRTGFFSDYTATATLSDGSSQVVTSSVTWSSSDPNVASVTSAGRLTGQTHGSMVLNASYQGRTGNKTVNIVNNYGGTWTGSYVATACDASGDFAKGDWCRGVTGATFALTLILSQTGNDRSQVSGTLNNGFITNAPVTGTVTNDGRLNIGSNATGTSNGLTFRFQLLGWETKLTSANQMTGRTAVSLSATGFVGNAYEEHNINNALLSNPQLSPLAER
jgi:Bacterial Ig-like domain (group 2)